MYRNTVFSLVLILALAFIVSCSGGNGNVTIPPVNERIQVAEPSGNTNLMGFWQVVIDKEAGTIEAVDLRNSDLIINVLGFLEPPALTGMSIDFGTLVIGTDTVDVDVILKHPIPDPVFMGFDVRGVVFGPKVTNSDGLTIIPCPEFFTGVPFGYQNGLLGVPASVGNYTGLAGYKYFCDDLGLTDDLAAFMSNPANLDKRGVFSPSTTNRRHYSLDWADVPQSLLVFNYAVYANYNWPIGEPPIELDDFEITSANSAEAFCAKVTELGNSLYYSSGGGGGSISLMVELWDWQGDVADVTVESGTIIPKTSYDVISGPGTAHSTNYDFYDVAGTPTAIGDLDILITAVDSKTFGEAWFLNLLPAGNSKYGDPLFNCFIYTATVADCPPPTITAIDPDGGWPGNTLNDVSITGAFINGASLAVKLTMTGETDIVATDVTFVSGTEITCDIDLTGAAPGDWTVVVTNGCGVDGELIDGFEVHGCGTMSIPPSYAWYGGGTGPMAYMGVGVTKAGNNRIFGQHHYLSPFEKLAAVDASGPWVTPVEGYCCPIGTHQLNSSLGFACDSQNNTYYCVSMTSSPYTQYVYTMPWNDSTNSWGSYSALPVLPGGYTIHRIFVDADDTLYVLGYSGLNKRIYTYDGTSAWTYIDITTAVSGSGGYMLDFAYNPSMDDFVVLRYASISTPPYGNMVFINAVDATTGASTFSADDIFAYVAVDYWRAGIYIDQADPDCRILIWGGGGSGSIPAPIIRYNGAYGQKVEGSLNYGSQSPGYNCNNADYSPELNRLFIPQQTFSTVYYSWPADW